MHMQSISQPEAGFLQHQGHAGLPPHAMQPTSMNAVPQHLQQQGQQQGFPQFPQMPPLPQPQQTPVR